MTDRYRGVEYVGPGKGRASKVAEGLLATRKVAGKLTGGAYSLFELKVEQGGGEPLHIQHREDECLYVVSGRFEFLGEAAVLLAGEGTTIYVPKGTLHSFRNVGEETGRLLVLHTPGGSYENFIEEAGRPVTEGNALPPMEAERLIQVAAEHGIEMVPPPF